MAIERLEASFPDLAFRPALLADARDVVTLVRATELAVNGEAESVEDDLVELWSRPGVDLAGDSLLVHDGSTLVAYAEIYRGRAEGCVAATHQRRGLGAALVDWWRARARAAGSPTAGQTISDLDTSSWGLLESLGATPTHTSWVLRYEIPVDGAPDLPQLHEVIIREARADEAHAVYETIDTAFNEWPGRTSEPFADWAATTVGRPDFEPWMAPVAVDPDGRIVGAAILRPYPDEGWVDQIAVARDRRGEGIARALLHHAFAVFADRGDPAVGLSTDSRTGALDLYLHVGMFVRRSYRRWTFHDP